MWYQSTKNFLGNLGVKKKKTTINAWQKKPIRKRSAANDGFFFDVCELHFMHARASFIIIIIIIIEARACIKCSSHTSKKNPTFAADLLRIGFFCHAFIVVFFFFTPKLPRKFFVD